MLTNESQANTFLDGLLGLPEIWGYQASPDGVWVAWSWLGVSSTMNVFAAPTDGSQPPMQLTQTDQNTWLVSWLPDGSGVIVGQDNDGNERAQLFRVDLVQPGVMHALTAPNPEHFTRGGQLHPNGRWLIYAANVDENGAIIEPNYLYRHDLTTGERVVLARPESASFYPPHLSPNGTHVFYYRKEQHPAGQQLWLVDIDGQHDREIVNVGVDRKVLAEWFPDGEHLLIHAEEETYYRVGVWSLADGNLRWLVDDPSRSIEFISFPRSSKYAVLFEVEATRYRPRLLDVATGQETPFSERDDLTFMPVAPAPDGTWTAMVYGGQQPDDIARVSSANESLTSLTHVWDRLTLSADQLVGGEDFRWTGDDGLPIQGWLYRAKGEPKGTIIYVHGGPTWHIEDRIDTQVQFFAANGYNVLAPNYRGSTGFNRAYQESIKVNGWGGDEQNDIRAGIEALIAAGIAQPGKVGITGTSYGGYSSWWAITHFPVELVAAAAPICGMTDLVIDYETTRPDLRPYSAEMMGGTPDEVPERFRERSPIHFVQNIRGRLLIVQGDQDPNVTPENVSAVRAALDAAGINYEVLTFPDEGHGIERQHNKKTLLRRLRTFFEDAFLSVPADS